MSRILVTGGRDYSDKNTVAHAFDLYVHCEDIIVHGDAPGADTLCRKEAEKRGIITEAHPANWKKFGKAAGPMRNSEMIESGIDLVIAFPGGVGTANCLKQARMKGLEIVYIK